MKLNHLPLHTSSPRDSDRGGQSKEQPTVMKFYWQSSTAKVGPFMKSETPPSFPDPEGLLHSLKALLKLLRSFKLKGNLSKWGLMCLITLGSGILKYGKKRKHFPSKLLKNITSSKSKAVGSHLFYLLIHLQLFLRRNQWSFSRLLRRKKTVTHSLPNVTLHWQGTLL